MLRYTVEANSRPAALLSGGDRASSRTTSASRASVTTTAVLRVPRFTRSALDRGAAAPAPAAGREQPQARRTRREPSRSICVSKPPARRRLDHARVPRRRCRQRQRLARARHRAREPRATGATLRRERGQHGGGVTQRTRLRGEAEMAYHAQRSSIVSGHPSGAAGRPAGKASPAERASDACAR